MEASVVLVDDHPLFRIGLRSILTAHGYRVVGEAGDARNAYLLVDEHLPDMVVLDVRLPGEDGISALRELRRRDEDLRVLMLSVAETADTVRLALDAGASGYALKHEPLDQILIAVERVARGERYLAPLVAQAVEEVDNRVGRDRRRPLDRLSPRERVIYDMLVRGFSNHQIAAELFISAKTVITHRAHVLQKLGVHSIAELVRFAARNGTALD